MIVKGVLGDLVIGGELPWSVVFDHGVEDDEELSHAGGEGDLGRFAVVFES